MNKTATEIVTICLIISAGFCASEMHSTATHQAGLRGFQLVPIQTTAVGLAAFNGYTVQSPEPSEKVCYESAVASAETGLEWMFPKAPPLHLLDLRNRL